MRLAQSRGRIEGQIGNAVADLTLRGAMKLLSPQRSDPLVEERAEGSAGTLAGSAVDPVTIKDGRKRRRRALNADDLSIQAPGVRRRRI
jgi:hypothetical protein